MRIRIKRFDKDLPLPEYKTCGAGAFDLSSRERVEILPRKIGYIPLNVAIAAPEGYVIFLIARSSLHKKGLMLINGLGVMDSDFCGDEDEYKAACFNFTDQSVVVEKGDRICQGAVLKYEKAEWEEAERMAEKTRGGFGTTGEK
ncbi:MAG: dUTP diphosphatase [Patescibacteria group bacterium]|nr:dUTP diphosphatase [Patescibacteria group bacterium]